VNGVHREACGAPGCSFVAGPSRDRARVQRLADEHRAAAHRLDRAEVAAVDAPNRGGHPPTRRLRRERDAAVFEALWELSEQRWQRGEPGWQDRPRGSYGDRETRRARKTARAERLARIREEVAAAKH
jgi:hypothetical protein